MSIITSARNSNGKHDVKYVHKLNNSNTVDKTELNFKRTSEKSGKRYKIKHSQNLKLKDMKVFLALLACFILVFAISKGNLLAYFTDIKNISNIFSIDPLYTVSFNSNTGTGLMAEQVISYNVGTPLTTNLFTKDGYVFAGWNTEPDGTGTAYADGESVTNLEDITLYAQWTQSTNYTVTFDFGSENFTGTNYINTGIPLFNNVNIHRDFEVTATITSSTYKAGENELRNALICNQYEVDDPYQGFALQYRDNAHIIKVQANCISVKDAQVPWGKTSGSITFKRVGSNLYYDNNFLVDYTNIPGPFTAPLTFGANLDEDGIPRRFSIADFSVMNVTLTYSSSEIPNIILPIPTRTGYVFDGWYTESTGGTKITTPSVAQLGNKTIYAHWIPESPTEYYIIYSGNGGTGSMSNQTIPYGTPTPLNTNTFTKTDATFNGWNTTPDGTGTSYSDGQTVTDIGNIVLYAQWLEQTYKVTFNYGSENFVGTNHIDTGIALFNDTNIHRNFEVTTTLSNFTHISSQDRDTILTNHYEKTPFQGFSLSYREGSIKIQATNTSTDKYLQPWGQSSGSINYTRTDNKLYFNNTFIIDFSNIHAKFYTSLIFGANVNYDGAVRRYLYGDLSNMCVALYYTNAEIPYITLPTPTKTGYTFDGWYTEATGGTKVTTPTVALLAGKTIYAHWINNNQNNQNNANSTNNLNSLNISNNAYNINTDINIDNNENNVVNTYNSDVLTPNIKTESEENITNSVSNNTNQNTLNDSPSVDNTIVEENVNNAQNKNEINNNQIIEESNTETNTIFDN